MISPLQNDLFGADPTEVLEQRKGALAARYGVPPFSVLDARQGEWQARKRAWLALGIQSELGRGDNLIESGTGSAFNGRSEWAGYRGPKVGGSSGNGPARTFGQDLMRGEHVVGNGKRNGLLGISESARRMVGGYEEKKPKVPSGLNGLAHAGRGQANYANDKHWTDTEAAELSTASGTSVFDPVLCELLYRWFCPPGGMVLDPFAGGSVRGIVAAVLGNRYLGLDLSERQIAANREQGAAIVPANQPLWFARDSRSLATIPRLPDEPDFVFSCPPYYDLEVYSDDGRDLSTMGWREFLAAYFEIIAACIRHLKEDRFACFVVGEVRDKRGLYRGFVPETISAFEQGGARFYNEAILVTSVGSLPVRVGKQFATGRKLGKTHQNCLIFVKGDPKKAAAACGPMEVPGVA